MGFGSRLPNSNDAPFQWGPVEPLDDFCVLLNDLGARCISCQRVTMHKFLASGRCPRCLKLLEEIVDDSGQPEKASG